MQPGKYRARATGPDDVQFGRTNNGNDQVAVLFRFTHPELEQETITWFGTFADGKATEITVRALRACGWAGDNLADMTGIDSQEVELVLVEEEDQEGNLRTKVRWVNKPGGGKVELKNALNQGEVQALTNRMKGYLIASKQGQPQAPRQGAPQQGQRPAGPQRQSAGNGGNQQHGGGARPAGGRPTGRSASPSQQGGYDDFAEQYGGRSDDDIPF